MQIFYDEVLKSALREEIPWSIAERGFRKIKDLASSVRLIEKDTSLPYPEIVVYPVLKVLIHESGVEAMVHGHIDFRRGVNGEVIPFINVSLPLLLNGSKHTYNYVLAHEFLHYIYLAQIYLNSDYFSMEQRLGETMISHMLFDEAVKVDAKKVFKSRYILGLMGKRQERILNDARLIERLERNWIKTKLPVIFIPEREFSKKFTISEFLNLRFPQEVIQKASKLI